MTSTESLRLPLVDEPVSSKTVTRDSANRAFSASILVSAIRCTLTYVIFPWVLPAAGVAGGVGPGIGLVIGVVAIAANVASIRRFRASDHRWKTQVTLLNSCVIAMLVVLVALDVRSLLG